MPGSLSILTCEIGLNVKNTLSNLGKAPAKSMVFNKQQIILTISGKSGGFNQTAEKTLTTTTTTIPYCMQQILNITPGTLLNYLIFVVFIK